MKAVTFPSLALPIRIPFLMPMSSCAPVSGPDTGAHELMGIKKGIRIGSARDGKVTAFIEDAESTAPDHSGAEGVGVDAEGNVYGAVVRRQMLERHVRVGGGGRAGVFFPPVLP